MIYLSVADLIDGLHQLKNGGKCYEFIGAGSSFRIPFNKERQGIRVLYDKKEYGPVTLMSLLKAIDSGTDIFLADPRNILSADSEMYHDFNASRKALKYSLS